MDKQIAEMARIIAFDLCPSRHVHAKWGEEAQCYSDNNFAECTKIKNVVDKLYNAGYRKIPEGEGAVVLTREEHQRYCAYKHIEPQIKGCLDREKNLEKQVCELDKELNLSKSVLSYDDEKPLDKWAEHLRKETAEKFAEMANKRIAQRQGERDCYEAFTIDDKARYDGDIVSLALFEICKELEGEK